MDDVFVDRRPFRGHRRSKSSPLVSIVHELPILQEDPDEHRMAEPIEIPKTNGPRPSFASSPSYMDPSKFSSSPGSPVLDGFTSSTPPTPGVLSRNASFSGSSAFQQDGEDLDAMPPLDRLTVFDFLENLALPQRLERLQNSLSAQRNKVRRQQQKLKETSKNAKDKVVDEWRKRVRDPEEQLDKYRRRMRDSVDRLGRRWTNVKTITPSEKVSFIAGVLNIFISGYLVGAFPEWFHIWYTVQVAYFYPIRYFTYHKRGYHYFLADLCYFVNLLLLLSIWVFPQSKRLFISVFCLAFGNNAVAIAMWRNSLVFHSLDKITSLFIHIMPCVTLHVLVHNIPPALQASRFQAVHTIKTSLPSSPEHYGLVSMAIWASVPYAFWQLSYHFLITVRRREAITAGRPTSFTWLRRSYAKTWIGKMVLAFPEPMQEPAFMGIQYIYALLTMVPAPLWFWSRWASATFLMAVFVWSIYNGASYYIDVFGVRFQKELEQLKRDVAKWQMSPELLARSPGHTPLQTAKDAARDGNLQFLSLGAAAAEGLPADAALGRDDHQRSSSLEAIPSLDGRPIVGGNAVSGVTTALAVEASNSPRARG